MLLFVNSCVRYDARLDLLYEQACTRHPKNVALTHVGNKILKIIWYMLYRKELYAQTKTDQYERKLKRLRKK